MRAECLVELFAESSHNLHVRVVYIKITFYNVESIPPIKMKFFVHIDLILE